MANDQVFLPESSMNSMKRDRREVPCSDKELPVNVHSADSKQ